MIVPRYAPRSGGVETHAARLAERIASVADVEVLTQEGNRELPRVERIDGALVRRFAPVHDDANFALAPGLALYLRRAQSRFDVVHAHSYHALPALATALVARSRPLVFTPHYHGTGHTRARAALHRVYRPAGRHLLRRSARIICVSRAEACLLRAHAPEVTARVTVIHNGVDATALREAEPYRTDRTVVLCVGRLEAYKRVDVAVRAMSFLDDRFVLVVAGAGPELERLRGLGRRTPSRVRVLGRIDDVSLRRWLQTASVVVSLSRHEAFGLTVLEGLCAGARVVASDILAHREIAGSWGAGRMRLVDPACDPLTVAGAVRHAAEQRCPVAPIEAPTWDEAAERTLRVYRDALEARR